MNRVLIKNLKDYKDKTVKITGWVNIRRDHGKLVFLDIRDFTGIIQSVSTPQEKESYKIAQELRPEWVVEVTGEVSQRPEKMTNANVQNGDIELQIKEIEVLNKAETPPFDVTSDGHEIGEEHRLEYRYLDLRRERLQKNIRNRHKVNQFIRNYLTDKDFVEVETPLLSKSTPEGARDYIVPSRLDKGKFYALPQSPQQYKQLLMVGGLERYFQLAHCMRDEDTRGDRQPEFIQLDVEASFVDQEYILNLMEELYTKLVKEIYPDKKITKSPWPRLNYKDVMKEYKTDSPDLRKDKKDKNELAFAWILDFPLFEKEGKNYIPSHHMFTSPHPDDIKLLDKDPGKVRGLQHDLVLNGNEIAGGSIRIHNAEIQEKIFDLIGFSKKEKEDFKHMLKAFTFGTPPHGGIASGLDRLMMVLENEPSIREVMAFPKTGEGRDLMMKAPSEIDQKQLKELSLEVKKPKK
jgi:aspartyl-tRNA synthetase